MKNFLKRLHNFAPVIPAKAGMTVAKMHKLKSLGCILFILGCLFGSTNVYALGQPVNAIAAIVNNQLITQADLNHQVAIFRARMVRAHQPIPSNKVLKEHVLQQMINQALATQRAKLSGLKITSDKIDSAIQRIAKQNHMTVDQLYRSVKKTGISRDDFRHQIGKQILIQTIESAEVATRVSISQQEINDYLKIMSNSKSTTARYHLQDILIALPDAPTPTEVEAARAKAEKVMAELKKGKRFSTLEAEMSGGQMVLKGGDLGWRTIAELPTPFVSRVEQMKVNSVAGPIRTPNGFHIIKLLAVHGMHGLRGDLAQRRREVQRMIFQRKFQEALMVWITQLRSQAYIKIFPQ